MDRGFYAQLHAQLYPLFKRERPFHVADRRPVPDQPRQEQCVGIADPGRAVPSKTGEELIAFFKSVFKEFSEEELATMHGLMNKLQMAAPINYAKHKKK